MTIERGKAPRLHARIFSALFTLAAIATPPGAAWCDLVFREVAIQADLVVLGRYEKLGRNTARIEIVEVLVGESDREYFDLPAADLRPHSPRTGSQFLLALDRDYSIIQYVPGAGACVPISSLPIRDGQLRGKYRSGFDGGSASMSLDQLREQLAALR